MARKIHGRKKDGDVIRSQSIRVAGIATAGLGIAVSGLTLVSTATAATKPEVVACGGGIVQKYKAKITFSGLASAPGETDVFSEMTLTFTQGGPRMLDSGTYELSNTRR